MLELKIKSLNKPNNKKYTKKLLKLYNKYYFNCQICGFEHFREKKGKKLLKKKITHLRYEICCNCSKIVKNNYVKLYYKHIIKFLSIHISEYFHRLGFLDSIEVFVKIKLDDIYHHCLELHNFRTFFKF